MEKRINDLIFRSKKQIAKIDDKEKTLLLIIDVQDKLMNTLFEKEKTIQNISALIKAFKVYSMKIIATEQYPEGLGRSNELILKNVENIFPKRSFDGYTKEVEKYCKENEITKILITGAETHICVFQTARRLLEEGYDVFIIEDGVTSFDKTNKNTGKGALRDIGAQIINTEIALFEIANTSEDPHFKEISKIVKENRSLLKKLPC
ncbi:MAG: isochorismatase family protein [Peptoniphilaceae bacterium]|nr:isochorismatase family protein [Peptoniphilaceae bacterium]MDY3738638.1 isochorismatase family protein [Peptoniphilaceae bacterium]